jgi:N-acetylated-alpha-linked acidic dipeptidase
MPATLILAAALSAQELDPATVARMPDAARLAATHALFASEPHVAGTAGDARTIERLVAEFRAMGDGIDGFEVEVQEFFPLLSRPVKARLEILGADGAPIAPAPGARRGVLALPVTEPNLAIDPQTAHPDLDIAWNAWSGSGTAEAGVVYVNYGRREDFLRLKELGIDPRGKIALARYGGNFRGYKAKFAEQSGCVGLVIFTDPADSGNAKGKTWPEGGGWANADCVQRGSLVTLPYSGDPLTPFRFAAKDAERLDPAAIGLPSIPVQPIGYGAAQQIFSRMKGVAAPKEWRGALASDYPLEDSALRLRLEVEQRREVTRTANVIARLRGAARPDEQVILGSHHDAWCFGAADPLAGTICTLESARNFCELARAGVRADRTLVFCAWGAEEYGIFGSCEFVEKDSVALAARTVAYVNLDMAAMGLKPGGAVAPTLRAAVTRALAAAPGPRGQGSALEAWSIEKEGVRAGLPGYGDLGGGSDHVAFWCHAGIPSVSLSAGGSEGTSYHSNYDTVAWYRATVGDDYAAAQLVTGMASAMLAEFASADAHVISPKELVSDCIVQSERLEKLARDRGLPSAEIAELVALARGCSAAAAEAEARLSRVPRADDEAALAALRTMWLDDGGLVGRPWFRNLYAATDRFSGYATASWPLLREAVEDAVPGSEDAARSIAAAVAPYRKVLQELGLRLQQLAAASPANRP